MKVEWVAVLEICPQCGEKHPMHSEWEEKGWLRTWDKCRTCDWSMCGAQPSSRIPDEVVVL